MQDVADRCLTKTPAFAHQPRCPLGVIVAHVEARDLGRRKSELLAEPLVDLDDGAPDRQSYVATACAGLGQGSEAHCADR